MEGIVKSIKKVSPEAQVADQPATSGAYLAETGLYGNGINAEPARQNSPKIANTVGGVEQINGKQNHEHFGQID